MTRASPVRQRGAALVTALFIVAIVTTIVAGLSFGQQVWLRQAQNLMDRAQANSMHRAALNFVGVLLVRELKKNNYDSLKDDWAQPQHLPFADGAGGSITVVVEDAQARFNINTLAIGDAQQMQKQAATFRRILELAGIPPTHTEAVIDWMDSDDETRGGGAEDTEYLNTEMPYRSGNQQLTSIDELRLIRGFDAEAVERLKPYLIAIPIRDTATPVNLNTAPDLVIAALHNNMTLDQGKAVVLAREQQPFETNSARLQQLLPDGVTPIGAAMGFNTSYFLVRTTITYGRWTKSTVALVHRESKTASVLWHHPLYPALPKFEDADEKNER